MNPRFPESFFNRQSLGDELLAGASIGKICFFRLTKGEPTAIEYEISGSIKTTDPAGLVARMAEVFCTPRDDEEGGASC